MTIDLSSPKGVSHPRTDLGTSSSPTRSSEVLVVMFPVGKTSETVFKEYAELVASQCLVVDLSMLSSFYTARGKSPFRFIPWDSGYMRLHFKQAFAGYNVSSDWSDFQSYRKVMGLLGICYGPGSDIDEAYREFSDYSSNFSSIKAQRCFVFEPSEGQVALDSKDREHLIMFPPGGRQTLEYHVDTMMHDFCANLLMAFEEYVLHAEQMGGALSAPLDAAITNEPAVQKKSRLGRVQKSIGDHCLLAGSALDAKEHYATAIDLARNSNDVLWHAGALEGLVASEIVNHEFEVYQSEDTKIGDDRLLSIRLMYYEAISLYTKRSATRLAQEATLKLASILSTYDPKAKKEVVELLSGAVERSLEGTISNQEKMVLMLEVSSIMNSIGYSQKAAFAVWQSLHLAESNEPEHLGAILRQWGGSGNHIALQLCLELLRMCTKDEESSALWDGVQRGVLARTLEWSVRCGDAIQAWSVGAQLMRRHHSNIPEATQRVLTDALKASAKCMAAGVLTVEPLLPSPQFIGHKEKPAVLQPYKWNQEKKETIFLYSPRSARAAKQSSKFANFKEEETLWVCSEEGGVAIGITNPYLFDLEIEHIQLSTSGVIFQAQPKSITVPKESKASITLYGTPETAGHLRFEGVSITAFGVTWFQRWAAIAPESFPSAHVVHQLPFLHRTSADAAGSIAVSQMEGERTRVSIDLMNSGQVPVMEIHATFQNQSGTQSIVEIRNDELERQLPLEPGTLMSVSLEVIAQHGAGGTKEGTGTIVILYAGSESAEVTGDLRFGRKLVVPVFMETRPGPRLRGINIHSSRGNEFVECLEIDLFNPTPETIEFEATTLKEECKPFSCNIQLASMCGRRMMVEWDQQTCLEKKLEGLELIWKSSSNMVGDLRDALHRSIWKSTDDHAGLHRGPSVVGFFSQGSGEPTHLKQMNKVSFKVMAAAKVGFVLQNASSSMLNLTLSFTTESASNSTEQNSNPAPAELLQATGSWSGIGLSVPASTTISHSIGLLPLCTGCARLTARISLTGGKAEAQFPAVLYPLLVEIS